MSPLIISLSPHYRFLYLLIFSSTILPTILSSTPPPSPSPNPSKYPRTLFSTYLPTISTSTFTSSPTPFPAVTIFSCVYAINMTSHQPPLSSPSPSPPLSLPPSSSTLVTVKLAPSKQTYPFSTTYRNTPFSLGLSLSTRASPSSLTPTIVATVSTWPWTKCPPMRVVAETARSRFTLLEGRRRDRFVRRRVSGDVPTLNVEGVNEVM
ncbi:MAG: hypothetical protein Q9216_006239, partial [Gyalolechia sp. 2 TL-2023]